MTTRKTTPSRAATKVPTVAEEYEARHRALLEVLEGHNARFERLEAGLDEVRGMVHEILDAVRQRPRGT
jgi:uncharacterized protein YdcH (DUF465 family)